MILDRVFTFSGDQPMMPTKAGAKEADRRRQRAGRWQYGFINSFRRNQYQDCAIDMRITLVHQCPLAVVQLLSIQRSALQNYRWENRIVSRRAVSLETHNARSYATSSTMKRFRCCWYIRMVHVSIYHVDLIWREIAILQRERVMFVFRDS